MFYKLLYLQRTSFMSTDNQSPLKKSTHKQKIPTTNITFKRVKAQSTDLTPNYFGRRIYEQSFYRKLSRSRLRNSQLDSPERCQNETANWEEQEAESIFDMAINDNLKKAEIITNDT